MDSTDSTAAPAWWSALGIASTSPWSAQPARLKRPEKLLPPTEGHTFCTTLHFVSICVQWACPFLSYQIKYCRYPNFAIQNVAGYPFVALSPETSKQNKQTSTQENKQTPHCIVETYLPHLKSAQQAWTAFMLPGLLPTFLSSTAALDQQLRWKLSLMFQTTYMSEAHESYERYSKYDHVLVNHFLIV